MNKDLCIVGVTGHRQLVHDVDNVKKYFVKFIEKTHPDIVITGMALGFDTIVAVTCIEHEIPFIAAIPFIGQERLWPAGEKEKYKKLVEKAWKIKIVSSGGYKVWKMFTRNEWIVDNSTLLLAYWNEEPKGGTYSCVKYGKKKNIEFINLFSEISM